MSFFGLALFSYLFESYSILEKAENGGFFYKNAEISEVADCKAEKNTACVKHDGKTYLVKKSGKLEIEAKIVNDSIHLTISPDQAYISYFLYIQTGCALHKIKLTKRDIVLEEKAANITRLQITGTGVGGPEILWSRKFKEENLPPFSENFDNSLRSLRKICKKSAISIDEGLEEAAVKSLAKIRREGLKHYSSKEGGIRHTGVKKKILGENLFSAKNEAEAWKMLVSSPSHLYNLIDPQFKHYFYAVEKGKDEVIGAIVFSD